MTGTKQELNYWKGREDGSDRNYCVFRWNHLCGGVAAERTERQKIQRKTENRWSIFRNGEKHEKKRLKSNGRKPGYNQIYYGNLRGDEWIGDKEDVTETVVRPYSSGL